MLTKFSFGRMQFDVSLSPAASARRVDPDASFGPALVGNFGGDAGKPNRSPQAQRRIRQIDCDNFEKVLDHNR